MKPLRCVIIIATVFLTGSNEAFAQQINEKLGSDPSIFLASARKLFRWDEPAEPAKIVGPIYFVGTKGLSVFLITTPEGHILLNTGMPGSGPMIEQSIRKLGFKPEEIRILLTGHAHCDHAGGHAYLKKLSNAKVAMIREEKELFESGGKSDFQYAGFKDFEFEPTPVDIVFTDGEVIKLGDISLTAILTNGHTKGSTSFFMTVKEAGRDYKVLFPNGTSVNPGYRLIANPSYSGIADDFRRTLRILESQKPDIWLHLHNESYGFDDKLARSQKEGPLAWVDPNGYQRWLKMQRKKFEDSINRERRKEDE